MSTTTSTKQKLDELKELFTMSMLALKQSHKETRRTMGTEQEDIAAAKAQQEDATEQALKLAWRERSLDFNQKGHEEQFVFNQQVQDNIAAASKQLGKLESTTGDREKSVINKAKEKLQEGAAALTDRQKIIRLADTAENGWGAVREYKGLHEFADNEDNTTMVNFDQSAGVKKRRIEASQRGSKRPRGLRQMTPVWAGYQQPMPPTPTFTPTPPMMPQYPPCSVPDRLIPC